MTKIKRVALGATAVVAMALCGGLVQKPAAQKVYCKNCGYEAASVKALVSSKCQRHPDGSYKGWHVLYEGAPKEEYVCKYCGNKAKTIKTLVSSKCQKHPSGSYKGWHSPAQ